MWRKEREGRIICCAKPGTMSIAVGGEGRRDSVTIVLVEGGGAVEMWIV
jgi:hypothetical protein